MLNSGSIDWNHGIGRLKLPACIVTWSCIHTGSTFASW